MRFADPYALRGKTSRETLVFAASQRIGKKNFQDNYFLNFNDECFALAQGVSAIPHGEVAAKLACETAIWGYKHIRQHRYYWLDKKLFMKRIFRSTNLTIWQKQREKGFEEGLKTTLMVVIVGPKMYWLGLAGDSSAWLVRSGILSKLSREKDTCDELSKRGVLGEKRLGLVPEYASGPLKVGDTLVLASSGCANYLSPSDIQGAVAMMNVQATDATNTVSSLLSSALANGSEENLTAVIIKRIRTEG